MELDKKRLLKMREDRKTIYLISAAYLTCSAISVYSMWYYSYEITIGLLCITAFLIILMYKYKDKITNG
jgi:hypothetical protein